MPSTAPAVTRASTRKAPGVWTGEHGTCEVHRVAVPPPFSNVFFGHRRKDATAPAPSTYRWRHRRDGSRIWWNLNELGSAARRESVNDEEPEADAICHGL